MFHHRIVGEIKNNQSQNRRHNISLSAFVMLETNKLRRWRGLNKEFVKIRLWKKTINWPIQFHTNTCNYWQLCCSNRASGIPNNSGGIRHRNQNSFRTM